MSIKKIYYFLLMSLALDAVAVSKETNKYFESFLKKKEFYSRSNLKYLTRGKILSNSDVSDASESQQKMWTKVAGLHSKKCKPVVDKLSKFEKYHEYMGFVDKSTYKDNIFHIELKVSLIPVTFQADIKIDRFTKPGIYPFSMNAGFLKGMVGELLIEEKNDRCFVYGRVDWTGKNLGFANFLLENGFLAMGKSGLESLFTLSGHKADR